MPARGKGRGRGKGKAGKSSAKDEGTEEVVDESLVEAEASDVVCEEEPDVPAEELDSEKAVSNDQENSANNNGAVNSDAPNNAIANDTIAQSVNQSESQFEQNIGQSEVKDTNVLESEPDLGETTIPKHTDQSDPCNQTQTGQESAEASNADVQDDYEKLTSQGISCAVATEICNCIKAGRIAYSDLTEEALSYLKECSDDKIYNAVKEFSEADSTEIKDKCSHLLSILKVWHDDKETEGASDSGPNEAKIKALLERTGYSHEVTSGQRHYGPPANWEGGPPGHDTEVFVGKVPWDVYEDELVPLFEECGKIYEIRIKIDPSTGANRGYAFVRYVEKESVKTALEKLNNYEIRPGKKIKLNESNPKKRLFIGKVPKTKSKEEIMEEFSKHTENLTDVIIYVNPDDAGTERKNRGFCFLDYASHTDAAEAKKIISKRGFRAFDTETFVDWADQIEENDDSVMSEVKNLYVRNLSSDVTEAMLKEKFSEFGSIEKVKRIKDYAFVHFVEREHAMKAIEAMNNYTGLGKCAIEVKLARPVTDKDKQRREQKKWEHQVQRMQRLGGLGFSLPAGGAGAGGAAGGVGGIASGIAGGGYYPPHHLAPAAFAPAVASPYASLYDYGYAYGYDAPMHHPAYAWDYAQPTWAARAQFVNYRSRGIGAARGFGGYAYGARGYAYSPRGFTGGHGRPRGGAMKRKAQDPPDAGNDGANDPKRHQDEAAAAEQQQQQAAQADAAAAGEQDWTSDVTATW